MAMAMVKASTASRRLHELSYDRNVVVYMEIEALEGMVIVHLMITHSVVKS